MAKSGLKKVTKLRKYINSRPTDEVKDNTVGTEGYIPDVVSNEQCPVGCDTVVEGIVLVQGTTTTTTTTTIAVTPEPNLVRSYTLFNPSTTQTAYYSWINEYGEKEDDSLLPNEEAIVVSRTQPARSSGAQIIITPTGDFVIGTTTTTTVAPIQSTDYTIDTSSASQNTVFSFQQPGSSQAEEVEIPSGSVVKITSDVAPAIVSGDQSPTITSEGAVTPQADTYTLTNNDYYNSTTVEYREYLGVTDEVILSPRESLEVVSQDTPVVTGSVTDVTITAAGNPTQEVKAATVPSRICNQRVLTNDSDYIATFEYRDCDGLSREVTLIPNEETTVGAINTPVLTTGTSTNVGSNFTVDTIERGFGTSGSATPVTPTTSTTTTLAPTTTTTTERLNVYDYNSGTLINLTESGYATDTESRWYPKEIKIGVSKKTGTFKFTSYDRKTSGMTIYRVYEGEPEFSVNSFTSSLVDSDSAMRLNVGICSDSFNGRFQNEAYTGMVSEGETDQVANAYCFGNKRVEPVVVSGYTSPLGYSEKTEFTLNKTTNVDYITVRIYQPYHAGLAGTSAVSYVSRFEITDVT